MDRTSRALLRGVIADSEAPVIPPWVPETIDQRIERVLASVPDLCGNCGGSGFIELDAYDDGVMAIDHADCPVCHGETEGDE